MRMGKGEVLRSDCTGRRYRIESPKLAEGGLGKIYRGIVLGSRSRGAGDVCLKVMTDPVIWHGESYFGSLLADRSGIVPMRDAFSLPRQRGSPPKYVLVFDWMDEGTVQTAAEERRLPWPEGAVRKGLGELLGVLSLMHSRGICHGDITPSNVFISRRRLLLGDFGLAKQSLRPGRVQLEGAAPRAYIPPDLVTASAERVRGTADTSAYAVRFWNSSADVYQVALLAMTLLTGDVVDAFNLAGPTGKLLRDLDASDELKAWLWDALARGAQRFVDAREALSALNGEPVAAAGRPRSLREQHVAFTGALDGMTRARAFDAVRRAGGFSQESVNANTTILVVGVSVANRNDGRTPLREAHQRIRNGQQLAIISDAQFLRLVAASMKEPPSVRSGPPASGSSGRSAASR
ncbi:MAG: hypothetical protein M0Z46_11355 [Actinomycetota bacterium]|nr:hypothetical protein [Actinomycetota bacterium]